MVPEHQRQGYAAEVTRELLRFAFDGLGADRVIAERHHTYDYLPGFETQVLWALTAPPAPPGPPER